MYLSLRFFSLRFAFFRFNLFVSILKKEFALFASLFWSLRFLGEKNFCFRFAFSIGFWAKFICLVISDEPLFSERPLKVKNCLRWFQKFWKITRDGAKHCDGGASRLDLLSLCAWNRWRRFWWRQEPEESKKKGWDRGSRKEGICNFAGFCNKKRLRMIEIEF